MNSPQPADPGLAPQGSRVPRPMAKDATIPGAEPGDAARGGDPPYPPGWTRRLVNVLVALAVIAVAGAAFVFSYAGVHEIALLGGVSARLARYYPGLFDAVLVIACVAAVMFHDRRWWARLWAWLVIIVVLGAIGTTDVLHAMNYTLRHRPTEGIVAAAPAVAVLLAFSLLVMLLRQPGKQPPSAPVATPPDVQALPAGVPAPPIALPAAAEPTVPMPVPMPVPAAPPTEPVPLPADGPAPGEDAEAEAAPLLDEAAAPTVDLPAVIAPPVPPKAQGIRYAGSSVRDTPPSPDYWHDEETTEFAGLVYRASDEDDAPADEPDARPNPQDLDDDAPPLATAPLAPMPPLNRVRSTPTPPENEDE